MVRSSTSSTSSRSSEWTLTRSRASSWSWTLPDSSSRGSSHGLHFCLNPRHLNSHWTSIKRDSVVLLQSFHGISSTIKCHLRSSKTSSAPVIVNRGRLEISKLRKELVNVGISDTKVKIGDNQLS